MPISQIGLKGNGPPFAKLVTTLETSECSGLDLFNTACQQDLEGIVAKLGRISDVISLSSVP